MATYAIGDIQGCFDQFRCLLKEISFDAKKDALWLAGDLVNRGPASLETLRYLSSSKAIIRTVLGNHDLHLLAIAAGVRKPGKHDTFDEILNAPDRDQLLKWLRNRPLFHYDKKNDIAMVHAGIPPKWSVTQAANYAQEVESILRGPRADDFFKHMYGNEPSQWKKSLTGFDRLRTITNYLTRMRICDKKGRLDLSFDTVPSKIPSGFMPWYAHSNRESRSSTILFGHWAALEGKTGQKGVYALDTGCVWGRSLTALRLEDKKLFSCDCSVLANH